MTHFLVPRRHLFHEARFLRMAPAPGEAPDPAPAPEAKTEKAPSTPDPKATFRKAQERIQIHGQKLNALRDKLKPLQTLQAKHEAGEDLKADELKKHGVEDTDGDGKLKAELDAKVKDIEDKLQPHQEALDAARGESDTSLKSIESQGAGGKLDAAFMRVDAVIKDPNASIGEKLAAVLMAFAEMQNVLKGITTPASAPGTKPGEKGSSPEGDRNSPSGKKEVVRQMLKDSGKDKLEDLQADKDAKAAALRRQQSDAKDAVSDAEVALRNAQDTQKTADATLAANKDNPTPAQQNAAREAKTNVSTAEAALKAAQDALASVTKDVSTAESDAKLVKEVGENASKDAKDFEQNKKILESKIGNLADNELLPEEQRDALRALKDTLKTYTANVADNGIDVSLMIPAGDMPAFLDAFVKSDVDPKELKIGANGVIEDMAAFQRGMDNLIAKAKGDATKAKAEEAK